MSIYENDIGEKDLQLCFSVSSISRGKTFYAGTIEVRGKL